MKASKETNGRFCACGADYSFRHHLATSCCECANKKKLQQANDTGMAAACAAVARAVKTGELKSPKECNCVDCGKAAMDYDHRDYAKPLDVVPVCRSCNKLRGPAKPRTVEAA